MSKTLQDHYGIDLYEDNNRLITKAWDKAQEKVRAAQKSAEAFETLKING